MFFAQHILTALDYEGFEVQEPDCLYRRVQCSFLNLRLNLEQLHQLEA
jgi:hypothetical protein